MRRARVNSRSATTASLRDPVQPLLYNHEFLHAIFDGVPDPMVVIDACGIIIMVNRAWHQYSIDNSSVPGQPAPGTGVGASYFDACRSSAGPASEGSDAVLEGIQAVLDGRSSGFSLEYPCHSAAKRRWFSMRVAPLGSGIRGAVIAHVEVTANKLAEEALAESEERWKFALEGAGEGVWDWNLATGAALFSRSWKEMFGYAEHEIGEASSEWESRVHPDDLPGVMQRIRDHLEGRSSAAAAEFRMRCRDGSWRWTLGRGKLVSRDASGKPLRIVGTNIDISDRKSLEEQLHLLAFYDTLTLLPNRRLLDNRLEQAMVACRRTGCFGALMFLDFDNFKQLNDLHGHAVGDQLLIEAARRLRNCVRSTDTAARFGGDEFVLMIGALEADRSSANARAHAIAEKVRAELIEPYMLRVAAGDGEERLIEHRCSISIGVSLFCGQDETRDDVLRLSDRAMYEAKAAGDPIRFA